MEDILDNESGVEDHLTQEISTLWTEHIRVAGQKKSSAAELRALRAKLAERLFEMKALLSRPGRGGQWRGWLSTVGIPRSTGDRLVERHAETVGIVTEDAPHEALSPEQEVENLVKSMLPRLRRVLTTPEIAYRFVVLAAEGLGLTCTTTEDGMLVERPLCDQNSVTETERCVDESESQPPPPQSTHMRFRGYRIAESCQSYKRGVES